MLFVSHWAPAESAPEGEATSQSRRQISRYTGSSALWDLCVHLRATHLVRPTWVSNRIPCYGTIVVFIRGREVPYSRVRFREFSLCLWIIGTSFAVAWTWNAWIRAKTCSPQTRFASWIADRRTLPSTIWNPILWSVPTLSSLRQSSKTIPRHYSSHFVPFFQQPDWSRIKNLAPARIPPAVELGPPCTTFRSCRNASIDFPSFTFPRTTICLWCFATVIIIIIDWASPTFYAPTPAAVGQLSFHDSSILSSFFLFLVSSQFSIRTRGFCFTEFSTDHAYHLWRNRARWQRAVFWPLWSH